jgi:hypothetical protein
MESDGYPGGGSSGVFHCVIEKSEGVQVEVAFKVMKEDSAKKDQEVGVVQFLSEVNMLIYLEKQIPDAKVVRVVLTSDYPDGIVANKEVAGTSSRAGKKAVFGVLLKWLSNAGTRECSRNSIGGARWNTAEMTVVAARSLLLSLQALHLAEVAHRDLKFANVCLNEKGEVVLIDLGGSVAALRINFGEEESPCTAEWYKSLDNRAAKPANYASLYLGAVELSMRDAVPDICTSARSRNMLQNVPLTHTQILQRNAVAVEKEGSERWDRIHAQMLDNSKSAVGEHGTKYSRGPNAVHCSWLLRVKHSTEPKRKEIRTRMLLRACALASDCYAAGLLILEMMAGIPARTIVSLHAKELKYAGRQAYGPGDGPKGGDLYGEDNILHDWVKVSITGQKDIARVVNTLRKFRGLQMFCAGGEGGAEQVRWTALATVLRGLLIHNQRYRWTAEQAVAEMSNLPT